MYHICCVVNNVVTESNAKFLYLVKKGCFARKSFAILLPRNGEENHVRDDHLVENASNVNNVSWVSYAWWKCNRARARTFTMEDYAIEVL